MVRQNLSNASRRQRRRVRTSWDDAVGESQINHRLPRQVRDPGIKSTHISGVSVRLLQRGTDSGGIFTRDQVLVGNFDDAQVVDPFFDRDLYEGSHQRAIKGGRNCFYFLRFSSAPSLY